MSARGKFLKADSYSLNYQVIDQNTVIIRPLQLDSPPDTSSYELRAEVRRRLKEGSLMPEEGARWTRTSEVYWEPVTPESNPSNRCASRLIRRRPSRRLRKIASPDLFENSAIDF